MKAYSMLMTSHHANCLEFIEVLFNGTKLKWTISKCRNVIYSGIVKSIDIVSSRSDTFSAVHRAGDEGTSKG